MAKIIQHGTSLGITLPKDLLERCNLEKGSEIYIDFIPDRGVIEIRKKPESAKELMAGFNGKPSDDSELNDWGEDVGAEKLEA